METIYENGWMKIYKEESNYYIQFNSGDLKNSIREIEVSEEDAKEAQTDDDHAYKIILKHQNQNK